MVINGNHSLTINIHHSCTSTCNDVVMEEHLIKSKDLLMECSDQVTAFMRAMTNLAAVKYV